MKLTDKYNINCGFPCQVLSIEDASLPPHARPEDALEAMLALTDFSACTRMERLELVSIFDDSHEPPAPFIFPSQLKSLNLEGATLTNCCGCLNWFLNRHFYG